MIYKNRVLWSDDGTIIDFTRELNDPYLGTITLPLVAAEDFLFLGSELPFNHRYIQITTGNVTATPAVSAIHLWDGDSFNPVVEISDDTQDSNDKSFAQSGELAWVPDRDKSWGLDDTEEGSGITGLTSVTMYDLYWMRLTFDADFDVGVAINYIGHKFSNDTVLKKYYPDLLRSSVLNAFESGKTDWDDQHIAATEECIRDLKDRGVMKSGNQVLQAEVFEKAAMHKAAEIIYFSFGASFEKQRIEAHNRYEREITAKLAKIDRNRDARENSAETFRREGTLFR